MNDENFIMELNENIFSSEDSNQVDADGSHGLFLIIGSK